MRLLPIVFVTAFDEHAVRASRCTRSTTPEAPRPRALPAACARGAIGRASSATPSPEALLAELERKEAPIVLRSGARRVLVDPAEVEWIEGADNYLRLHGGGAERLVRGTLAEMEALLAPHGFLRVHRSLLVNERVVRELVPRKGGELTLVLASGTRLVASRSHRRAIEERWRGRRLSG
jgi:two-component system LytT family response regulator